MAKDPLQLVAYWSVDCHFDGNINRPDAYFCKDSDGIKALYESIGSSFWPVLIKVVDIFGNVGILNAEI